MVATAYRFSVPCSGYFYRGENKIPKADPDDVFWQSTIWKMFERVSVYLNIQIEKFSVRRKHSLLVQKCEET